MCFTIVFYCMDFEPAIEFEWMYVCSSVIFSPSTPSSATAILNDEQMIRHSGVGVFASDGNKVRHTAAVRAYRRALSTLHQGIVDEDRASHTGGASRQTRPRDGRDRCHDHPRRQGWRPRTEPIAGSRQQTAGQDGRRISAGVVRKTDRRRWRVLSQQIR